LLPGYPGHVVASLPDASVNKLLKDGSEVVTSCYYFFSQRNTY